MHRNLPAWQKNTLRVLAFAGLAALVWSMAQQSASAQQGVQGHAEVESDFWADVFRSIFTFNTKMLMDTLGRPEYMIPAFIILNVIIFTETGLLIGFFLPGDS